LPIKLNNEAELSSKSFNVMFPPVISAKVIIENSEIIIRKRIVIKQHLAIYSKKISPFLLIILELNDFLYGLIFKSF
jgi:hypothetical protein